MDDMWSAEQQIPNFGYQIDPESYLSWEKNIESVRPIFVNCSDYVIVDVCRSKFEHYAKDWWAARQYDVMIRRKSPIRNWHELKACMRRTFLPPSYEKNKKIREEIRDLAQKGRRFIEGEKEFWRREKEFKERVQELESESIKREMRKIRRRLEEMEKEEVQKMKKIEEMKKKREQEEREKREKGEKEKKEKEEREKKEEKEKLENERKKEELLFTPLSHMNEKESLKGDCNTLNSSSLSTSPSNFSFKQITNLSSIVLLPREDLHIKEQWQQQFGEEKQEIKKEERSMENYKYVFNMPLYFSFCMDNTGHWFYYFLVATEDVIPLDTTVNRTIILILFAIFYRLVFDPGGGFLNTLLIRDLLLTGSKSQIR